MCHLLFLLFMPHTRGVQRVAGRRSGQALHLALAGRPSLPTKPSLFLNKAPVGLVWFGLCRSSALTLAAPLPPQPRSRGEAGGTARFAPPSARGRVRGQPAHRSRIDSCLLLRGHPRPLRPPAGRQPPWPPGTGPPGIRLLACALSLTWHSPAPSRRPPALARFPTCCHG